MRPLRAGRRELLVPRARQCCERTHVLLAGVGALLVCGGPYLLCHGGSEHVQHLVGVAAELEQSLRGRERLGWVVVDDLCGDDLVVARCSRGFVGAPPTISSSRPSSIASSRSG
jgi:hypothetical protein